MERFLLTFMYSGWPNQPSAAPLLQRGVQRMQWGVAHGVLGVRRVFIAHNSVDFLSCDRAHSPPLGVHGGTLEQTMELL